MNLENYTGAVNTVAVLSALALFGLIAGFFYAFSVCVMPGLNRISPNAAIEAMQGINEAVRNPVFFITFFVTPVTVFVAAALAYRSGSGGAATTMALAGLCYLIGGIVITAAINVPMNEALAVIDPATGAAERVWLDYTQRWTFWNTVRTVASLVAMLTFAVGIGQLAGGNNASSSAKPLTALSTP